MNPTANHKKLVDQTKAKVANRLKIENPRTIKIDTSPNNYKKGIPGRSILRSINKRTSKIS